MKKSTKAVLLSALVFPGSGHIFLKKYTTGIILITASIAAAYYLVSLAIDKAFEIAEKIQSGDVPLDLGTISNLVSQQSTGTAAQLENVATIALIIFWLVGIVDSYRLSRGQN